LSGRNSAFGAPPLDFPGRGIYNEVFAGLVGSSWSGFQDD
jgi:hypothetical protein